MNRYSETADMITTLELLEEVKKAIGNDTVYTLAKVIDCSRPTVDNWLKGGVMTDPHALRCADLTNLDPGYVLYSIAAERAQKSNNERLFNYWKTQADKINPIYLSITACFLTVFSSLPTPF